MNKKRNIIIVSVVIALIVAAVVFVILSQRKITISFDSDGGNTINILEIKKGEKIKLPEVTKEGYVFDGWYLENTKVNDDQIYNKSSLLKAKWITEEAKTFVVTFDSNGGIAIEAITLVDGQSLTLPSAPKRDGYTFKGWYDKNDKAILDGALLTCEDITLTAKWEKVKQEETKKTETKKEETKKEETKKEETKPITYSCETGWVLNGTKCEYTYRTSAKFNCPNGTYEVNGKCVYINASNRVEATKTCKSNTYGVDNYGHTETFVGKLIVIPNAYSYCVYGEVKKSDEQSSQNTCTARGHVWAEGKCYYGKTSPGANMNYTCNSGYTYIEDPNSYSGVNGLNRGCFKTVSKEGSCQTGYDLSGNYCFRKEIKDATAN